MNRNISRNPGRGSVTHTSPVFELQTNDNIVPGISLPLLPRLTPSPKKVRLTTIHGVSIAASRRKKVEASLSELLTKRRQRMSPTLQLKRRRMIHLILVSHRSEKRIKRRIRRVASPKLRSQKKNQSRPLNQPLRTIGEGGEPPSPKKRGPRKTNLNHRRLNLKKSPLPLKMSGHSAQKRKRARKALLKILLRSKKYPPLNQK